MDGEGQQTLQFGYGLNYLIDIENAVIVDVEATPARTYDEVRATKTMIERTEQRLGLKPERLMADTAYGTGSSWVGSSVPASPRRSRYGRWAIAKTEPSRAATSLSTERRTNTPARTARPCGRPAGFMTAARSSIG